jgi:hypothetical protein
MRLYFTFSHEWAEFARDPCSVSKSFSTWLQIRGDIRDLWLSVCYRLKGLSHEIFGPVFWPVWMNLGLNVNRLWFLNFNDAPLNLDN